MNFGGGGGVVDIWYKLGQEGDQNGERKIGREEKAKARKKEQRPSHNTAMNYIHSSPHLVTFLTINFSRALISRVPHSNMIINNLGNVHNVWGSTHYDESEDSEGDIIMSVIAGTFYYFKGKIDMTN